MTPRQRFAMRAFLLIDDVSWRFGRRVGRARLVLRVKRFLAREFLP